MNDAKPKTYYWLALLFTAIGLFLSVYLTSAYFSGDFSALCKAGGTFDCSSISGRDGEYSTFIKLFSGSQKSLIKTKTHSHIKMTQKSWLEQYFPFLNVPLSTGGIGLYLMIVLYFLFHLMSSKGINYLKIPFFILLILANLFNLVLFILTLSLYSQNGKICIICWSIYLSTFAMLLIVYFYDFKGKKFTQELRDYIKSFFKETKYLKGLLIYGLTLSLIFVSLFYYSYSKERSFQLGGGKSIKQRVELLVKRFYTHPIHEIDTKNAPVSGEMNSPNQFIVFHDLQCGHCRNSFYELEKLVKQNKSIVKVSYLNLPMFLKAQKPSLSSFELAQYSIVAHQEGQYLGFLDSLFKSIVSKQSLDKKKVKEIFKSLGINVPFSEIEARAKETTSRIVKESMMAYRINTKTLLLHITKMISTIKDNTQKKNLYKGKSNLTKMIAIINKLISDIDKKSLSNNQAVEKGRLIEKQLRKNGVGWGTPMIFLNKRYLPRTRNNLLNKLVLEKLIQK